MPVRPVILCGGAGARLWPASRPSRPKQFIPLLGERSLFQATVARLRALEGALPPLVVAGAAHEAAVRSQLAEIEDVGAGAVLMLEPEGRDSAPAIAAAAAWIGAHDPEALALVVASDHHIPDAQAFAASVSAASPAAAQGRLVAFGVKPGAPATAYGYIQPGEALAEAPGVFALVRFVEKPDAETAAGYVAAGYLWNSGNFLFSPKSLTAELRGWAPEVAEAAAVAVAQAGATMGPVVRLGPAFAAAPKISIDYAVMEKTALAAVAPVDFAWSDLGAWDAVWAASSRDADGNAASAGPGAQTRLVDSRDSLVRAEAGVTVVGIGLRRLAVVAAADAVLVCDLDASQGVKGATGGLAPTAGGSGMSAAEPSLAEWRQRLRLWLEASALPLWWSLGADHGTGGFYEALDASARPVEASRRARVQARQIYAYATAHKLGWGGPWKAALDHGLAYFLGRYRRDDGLFRTLVDAGGAPADDTAMLYDQAFALLGMAAAADASPSYAADLGKIAARLLAELRRGHGAGEAGGFRETGGASPYQSNPHMHLFEAALAWEAVESDPWSALADELAELCLSRLIDPETGAVRELYDEAWRPLSAEAGDRVEPGHQFEWAWLLERWGAARNHAGARTAARRLFEVGTRGVGANGAAVNALMPDLAPADAAARLWPQTEWLKAALILRDACDPGDGGSRNSYEAAARSAAATLSRFLDTPVPGLWRDRLRPDGSFETEAAPASSLYHIVCSISELSASA